MGEDGPAGESREAIQDGNGESGRVGVASSAAAMKGARSGDYIPATNVGGPLRNDWIPASPAQSPRPESRYPIVRNQFAIRDVQMLLFMLHNKRFELLNAALSLWKGFLHDDRRARPDFEVRGLASLRRKLEQPSSSQSSSGGGGIRKWLQRGYSANVNRLRPDENTNEHGHVDAIPPPTSLNALMDSVRGKAAGTV